MAPRKPTRKPGRARDRGDVRLVTFEFPIALDESLEECASRDRRSKKAIVTIALEDYLKAKGLWPYPPPTA